MVERLFNKFGVDGAISFSLIARVIQIFGGLLSIILISSFLSKEEQGYYYTFSSIVAIQVFFELGLNSIITQYVAHEAAHLQWKSATELTGSSDHLSRLSSLLQFCLKLFGILCIVLFVVLYVAGSIFFTHYNSGAENISWQWPWLLLAAGTALMFFVNPILAFLEGLGKVKEVARIKILQQCVCIVAIVLLMLLKGGLFVLSAISLVSFIILTGSILFSYRRGLLIFIYKAKGVAEVNYWKEIFPYQYKIAISWISGFFIFHLFNPVLFATEGATVAGQMGITLQALNGISTLSMSWITTKVPLFCSLIAKKEYTALDRSFNTIIKQLAAVSSILLLLFMSFITIVDLVNHPLANRFLPLIPLIFLCVVTFVNQFIFSWATYLRCHKQEPFLVNSLVGGILCVFSTILLGRYFGLMGVVTGYTLLTLLVGVPWSYAIFVNKKNSWHTAY